jgi:hypothetical protein
VRLPYRRNILRLVRLSPSMLMGAMLAAPPPYANSFTTGQVNVRSLSKITFGPDGILFIGDSIGAKIFAVDLDDRTPLNDPPKMSVTDLEGKIGGMLGADARDVLIHAMAVNPISKNTYLAVSRGRRNFTRDWQLPNEVANANVLLRVTPAGNIQEVRLNQVKYSAVEITGAPREGAHVDGKKAERVDTISDMAFADGKLYVSGLSNEEFASTMRIFPFPFAGPASASSLEIYHGSHGKYETKAPVRAFLPIRIRDKPYVLASYLCTPLVLFTAEELKDKKHVKGKTIGEFGDGNYPLDMLGFQYKGKDYVMVVNSTRGVIVLDAAELAKPLPSITAPIEDTAGVAVHYLRNRGALEAENYGAKDLMILRRDAITGDVSLESMQIELP